jgi:hypothetical protein
MDPSTTKHDDQWFDHIRPNTLNKHACIVWTLHDDGPFESEAGQAPSLLKAALEARKGIYRGGRGQSDLHYLLRTLERFGVVERESGGSRSTTRLALVPGVPLPPSPYRDKTRALAAVDPPTRPAPAMADTLDAGHALAAVASFVESAMAMAGVTPHEADSDDRLADALAEARRLHGLVASQGEQLTALRKELEVARRALAHRDGQHGKR